MIVQRPLTAIFMVVVSFGCAQQRQIKPYLENIKTLSYTQFPTMTLHVLPLQDDRESIAENQPLFTQNAESKVEGQYSCINAEQRYDHGAVSSGVTRVLGQYLQKRNLFARVTYGPGPQMNAQLYLRGRLKMLYGRQGYSVGAAVAGAFGLVGAAIASGIQTETRIIILIDDLTISDRAGNIVARLEPLNYRTVEVMQFDTNCISIYEHVDRHITYAASNLATSITRALESGRWIAHSPPPPGSARPSPHSTQTASARVDELPQNRNGASSSISTFGSEACRPACRGGFFCYQGRCASPCNPPCAPDEVCTKKGACIPKYPRVRR